MEEAEAEESERLSNQITLLLLFKALHELGFTTRRLKLEKLVYFAKVIGKIFGETIGTHEFFVWKYGPFSKQVYSDLEVCVTRGLVKATPLNEFEEPDEKSFEYSATETGLGKAERALEDSEFRSKYDIILKSLQATARLTSGEIKRLSYGEPDFRRASKEGRTTVVNPEFPLTIRISSLAKEVAEKDFGIKLSDEGAALLYLKLVEALAPTR
jgi:uncharacterized protein YwgA